MIQEIFNFDQAERLSWSDFVESEENREVVACLSRWPRSWNSNGVVIYGGPKVGKTHLASLWAQSANAIYVLRSGFFESPRALFASEYDNFNFVIDNLDVLFEELDIYNLDKWMFDFFNICKEKKRSFLLLSRLSPSSWNVRLKDLRSRLQTLPAICIKRPNDTLLLKIAKKISMDFGIAISDSTLNYLIDRITRDVPSISETLKKLNRLAMQKKKSITTSFVRQYISSNN